MFTSTDYDKLEQLMSEKPEKSNFDPETFVISGGNDISNQP